MTRFGRPGKVLDAAQRERDIVLLCNPKAGGHWKELAAILDSEEAQGVRRIVTDSIDDITAALAELGNKAQLICIYGGDGTIQRVLDRMHKQPPNQDLQLAFIGGGTMNVVARWCGLTGTPGRNFRDTVRAYLKGELLFKEVPLLCVRQQGEVHFGFTFGMGPLVRLLEQFEKGAKSKLHAVNTVVKSVAVTWSNRPAEFQRLIQPMEAEVMIDGQKLPYDRYALVFCNTTGRLFLWTDPFVRPRTRETFHIAAYAAEPREFTLMMPFLMRGWMPIDPQSLRTPIATWKQVALSFFGQEQFPTDPRYINKIGKDVEIHAQEKLFTIDGELMKSCGEPINVQMGPLLKLAVSDTVGLDPVMQFAARMMGRAANLTLNTLRRGM